MTLLKTLVKDIEEAAHAVSGGTVGQRDAIAMAAGGHPQLVETVSDCCIAVFVIHELAKDRFESCVSFYQ